MAYSRKILNHDSLIESLAKVPSWEMHANGLHKKFQFADFASAWLFMQKVAVQAEALDHHPDWRNVYNTVEIKLSTHDAGGLTALDFALAERIDAC